MRLRLRCGGDKIFVIEDVFTGEKSFAEHYPLFETFLKTVRVELMTRLIYILAVILISSSAFAAMVPEKSADLGKNYVYAAGGSGC